MRTLKSFKFNRGSALIVALMITLIIGIIAISLAGIAYKGQRRENAFLSTQVSYNNALSGINRALLILSNASTSPLLERISTDPTRKVQIGDSEIFNISGKDVTYKNIKNYFAGIDQELDTNTYLNFTESGFTDTNFWFRNDEDWGITDEANHACANCVQIDDGNLVVTYRIEMRDFAPFTPAISSSSSNVGYQFYRITALGRDPNDDRARTILQTNVGVLSSR